ncbi:ABC transporter ATP-binding protein [Desulfonatronospira sp.]|uniref:ABC transporter ATP-binding protein n=1 Tax=Desulfonatronospira sp. TaxID=1962951 RepID=UPI0025BE565D|nr:ABC transporter ATP-binding protein [Desulfonatronospira sp.]
MLTIEDLFVKVGGREILKGINLQISDGENYILFGPNGSGKTSLLMTLMGFDGYEIVQGRIYYDGQDITHMPAYERARLGIGMSFQRPPTIHGLKTRDMVKLCAGDKEVDVDEMAKEVNFTDLLDRDINSGFSGGEIKRSELLQLMAQDPGLVLFDEPESGVDLENMNLIGKVIRGILDGPLEPRNGISMKELKSRHQTSGLIITHTGYILDYINADRGQVLYEGKLCCTARPRDILDHISKYGYKECVRCLN